MFNLARSVPRATISLAPRASAVAGTTIFSRGYALGDDRREGSTATSKGWSEKERADETRYARQQEEEKIKKIKESIKKQRESLDNLEKDLNELGGGSSSQKK